MVRSVFALVALLGAAAGVLAETWPLNHRQMQIPIRIEPARRGEIKELQLWYSTDEGRNWSQGGAATPDKEAFTFNAPNDGVYWFGLIIERKDGSKEPANAFKLTPSMKVIVDTTRPVARAFSADRQGDEVLVRWEIQEANPDWGSMKLEYRTAEMPSWMWNAIPAKGVANGKAQFRPTQNGPMQVRLQVKDQAGNETVTQKEVAGAVNTVSANTPTPAAPVAVPPPDGPPLPLIVNAGDPAQGTTPGSMPAVQPPSGGVVPPPEVAPPEPRTTQPLPPRDPQPPVERNVVPAAAPPARTNPSGNLERTLLSPPNHPPAETGNRLVASSTDAQVPAVPGGGTERSPAVQTPGLILSNSVQITLDYEVSKVGPSGVGSVELWLTRNQGNAWEKFAEDSDLKPPMIVDLPGEGTYGITLVVRSRAGLGRNPPRDGERPQMMVEVDLTSPEAKLYAPRPVRGQRDLLQIVWEASDKNLAPTPINLEWSERPNGPWQPIALDQPNSGQYNWKLPPNLPYKVFMRLAVRDAAGNVSAAETRDPVLVDLSVPEGVIKDVRPSIGTRPPQPPQP